MQEEPYPFTLSRQEFRYEFVSVSERKKIIKIVLFTRTRTENTYNLALFDVQEDGSISDSAESNNNDLRCVLATVIRIIEHFLTTRPESLVIFRGSDLRRQRLYRIVISRELPEILKKFEVYGSVRRKTVLFRPDTAYDFYIIQKL